MIKKILQYTPQKQDLWKGAYKIPWNNPAFSERMLKMHLSQAHDMASRRNELIEKQIKWIDEYVLKMKPSRILDIGCGPGLYIKKLHGLQHQCTGIDFSPASINYARTQCPESTFLLDDVRDANYGNNYDLVMLLFGEINVFSPKECLQILHKSYNALKKGGVLLIEAHLFESVKKMGSAPRSWSKSGSKAAFASLFDPIVDEGLFSDQPHITLIEHNWSEEEKVSLSSFWILEEGKELTHYVSTTKAYSDEEYKAMLQEALFEKFSFHNNFGEPLGDDDHFQVIMAVK